MYKPAITAVAMLLAFGVAACDQGGQEQAREPSTPAQETPSATPSPQQGTAGSPAAPQSTPSGEGSSSAPSGQNK